MSQDRFVFRRAQRFLWDVGAVQGCALSSDFSLWGAEGAEQPFCCLCLSLRAGLCISEALHLSRPFKHVQGREFASVISVGPLQLRRLSP